MQVFVCTKTHVHLSIDKVSQRKDTVMSLIGTTPLFFEISTTIEQTWSTDTIQIVNRPREADNIYIYIVSFS